VNEKPGRVFDYLEVIASIAHERSLLGESRPLALEKVRSAHVNARCDDQDTRTAHRRFGSDVLKAIDFRVPVKRLVWLVARDRIFGPRRNTYDELLATGRIVVLDDPVLRTSIIEHYALIEDVVADLQD
jgi:hypothetical protein